MKKGRRELISHYRVHPNSHRVGQRSVDSVWLSTDQFVQRDQIRPQIAEDYRAVDEMLDPALSSTSLSLKFFNIQGNRIFNVPCHHCAGLGIKEDNFCIDSRVRRHLGIFFPRRLGQYSHPCPRQRGAEQKSPAGELTR